MKSAVVKHSTMFLRYISLAVKRQVEYKVSFYTFILHQMLTIVIWLIFWRVLIGKFGKLGVWDYNRMVMLIGFVSVNMGFFMLFGYIWKLPKDIISGNLNSHLIKPVHPFVHLMLKQMNLRSVPRVLMGGLVVGYAIWNNSDPIAVNKIVLASIMSLASFLTTFMPFAMLCLTAFWLGRAEFLRDLFIELFLFQQYPLSEFPRVMIIFFSLFVPLIFSATTPVLVLTQWPLERSLMVLAGMILITVIQILLFRYIWKKGLRRYESNGG